MGYELKRVQAASRAALQQALRPHALTLPQYVCLELLEQWPGLSTADLARASFVSRQSMNGVLHTLRAAGLVRFEEAGPKRRIPVHLTPAGQERLIAARSSVLSVERRMVAGFTVGEIEHLLEQLRRIRLALRESDGDGVVTIARTVMLAGHHLSTVMA